MSPSLSSLCIQGKMKADRNRARVEENFLKQTHAQRQEAAQTRREEKKRAEKERIMNEEDPERQRRLEVWGHIQHNSLQFWESGCLLFGWELDEEIDVFLCLAVSKCSIWSMLRLKLMSLHDCF